MTIESGVQICLNVFQELNTNHKNDIDIRDRLAKELNHARDVQKWATILTLPTPFSFELQISALFHDSERWINIQKPLGFSGNRNSLEYDQHKKMHAKRSADFADSVLLTKDICDESRKRIRFLIEHHDDKGEEVEKISDSELNTLVASDSFSFFTSIAKDMLQREGPQRVEDKVRFMVEKMPKNLLNLLSQQTIDIPEIEKIKTKIISEFLVSRQGFEP